MSEALVRLLLLSLAGSLLALLLYLLQPLLKRLVTRRILYVLWVIVMVRMVVPVGIASVGTGAFLPPATPTPAITQPITTHAPTAPVVSKAPTPSQLPTPSAAPTQSAATPTPAGSAVVIGGATTGGGAILALFSKASDVVDGIVRSVQDSLTPLSAALLAIWLLGALVSLSFGSVRHRRILRAIRREARPASPEDVAMLDACRTEFRIRQPVEMIRAPSVPTPILSGIRRPLLCLPEREFTPSELRLVLQHELMHLKHRDLWVKRVTHWVCAVHWFNPTVHLIRHELTQAAELACDESVSARLEKADRQRYGEVLLQQAAQRPYPPFSGTQALSESGRRLRQRLRVIAHMKAAPRRKRVAGLAALLLLLVVPLPQFAPIALTGCTAASPTPSARWLTAQDLVEAFQHTGYRLEEIDGTGPTWGGVLPHNYAVEGIPNAYVSVYICDTIAQREAVASACSQALTMTSRAYPDSTYIVSNLFLYVVSGAAPDYKAFFKAVENSLQPLLAIPVPTLAPLATLTLPEVEAAWKAVGLDVDRQSPDRGDLALGGVVPTSYIWKSNVSATVCIYVTDSYDQRDRVIAAYDASPSSAIHKLLEHQTLQMRLTYRNLMFVAACTGTLDDANEFFRLIQIAMNRLDSGTIPTLTASPTPTIPTTPTPTPMLVLPDAALAYVTIGTPGYRLLAAANVPLASSDDPVVAEMTLSDGRVIHFTYRDVERGASPIVSSMRIEGSPELLPTPDATPVFDTRIIRGGVSIEVGASIQVSAFLPTLGTPTSDNTIIRDGIPSQYRERTIVYPDVTIVLGQDLKPSDPDSWFLQSAAVTAASCVTGRGLAVDMTPEEALGRFATGAFVVDSNFEALVAGKVTVYVTLAYPDGPTLAPAWNASLGGIYLEFQNNRLVTYDVFFASGAD